MTGMTAQERRIARELGCIYLAFFVVSEAWYMQFDLGTVPQWITALVAIVAGSIAWNSLLTQRETARKRAALDLFLKAEMDKSIADKFERFDSDVELLKSNSHMPMADFEKAHSDVYKNIVHCLNMHELVAVGIYRDVLDADVCYEFWHMELLGAHHDTKAIREYLQNYYGKPNQYYRKLDELAEEWERKAKVTS